MACSILKYKLLLLVIIRRCTLIKNYRNSQDHSSESNKYIHELFVFDRFTCQKESSETTDKNVNMNVQYM